MLQIQADSIFIKGSSHQICQDYATHRAGERRAFASVSDGCSSSKDTDVGARLITYLALSEVLSPRIGIEASVGNFGSFMGLLFPGLSARCLDATLWYTVAEASDEGAWKYRTVGYGDGAFVRGNVKTGMAEVVRIHYSDGAPEYISNRVIWKGGERFTRSTTRLTWETLCSETTVSNDESTNMIFEESGELFDGDYVIMLSDGIESFNELSWLRVVEGLSEFKSLLGEFVTRRAKRFKSTLESHGSAITHFDDLSVAGVALTTI